MELRISSIPIMLEYLSETGAEPANRAVLQKIFDHEDYQFEARRYGLSSVEPLISYFSHLKNVEGKDIPDLSKERKSALRDKHNLWLDCASNPQKYYTRYEKVKHILCENNIQNLQHKLSAAFPDGAAINDSSIIVTLSFGPSFGYVYENALHLDLFGIEDICTIEELPYIILHEMHHLQVQKLTGSYHSFTRKFSLLDNYIFRFSGEGLAIKFCNNAEGVISRRIDSHLNANIGIPAMAILNNHFEEHFNLFNDTIKRIKQNSITASEIEEQFRSYWWNPQLYKDETTFLTQTPIYSFGNEIFGCIFDAFGMEILFECFYNPARVIGYFNKTNCGYIISDT
ncbi:MAG: hypothetical protein HFH87_00225 [Lachnospiraceae bacterium]|nr:hypothetical protein [Lachnospiraceae bacterium]